MEVSNEIKEEIRKTQADLKNAIRVHQVWVARLQEDEQNSHLKSKVKQAENDIIAIGQAQKLVVDRLRRELELYQQRLKVRNKLVNVENDNRYVAQQLRDHQIQFRNRSRTVSLLKPSVLNEIQIKSENNIEDAKGNVSDSSSETKYAKKQNHSEYYEKEKCLRNFMQISNTVHDSRNNFASALNKVKEAFLGAKIPVANEWPEQRSDSDSCPGLEQSPSPSPPPIPDSADNVPQEVFMRFIGLVTPSEKELVDKKRSERRKRTNNSSTKNEFLYGNYEMMHKKKKHNSFPYLQSHSDPPQTRSAKLRKQQNQSTDQKSSREGSPTESTGDNKAGDNGRPSWMASLPPGLSVEPVPSPVKKACEGCGGSDVPSLLVGCGACGVRQHTGCAPHGCVRCGAALPEPPPAPPAPAALVAEKLSERKRLQEKNIELCVELRKLEMRAANLKESLDEHNAEKRQLLADQIRTQRDLQKLLDFISQFKETSLSIQSTSISDSGSDFSKSNEE